LRLILSKYTKTTPGELIFSHNKHGKPFLEGKQIYFNLSHSEDLSLIAVSLISRIGIDVEKVREVPNFMQIAKLFFADEESKNLEVLPEKSRASAFFKTWTCKEAFTKAVGEGLSLDLRSFSIQFAPKAQIQFLNNMQKHLNSLNWSILELILSEGYMGALAVEEKNPRYFYYQLL
jgi:4'-phosphopantetheinyl transferase